MKYVLFDSKGEIKQSGYVENGSKPPAIPGLRVLEVDSDIPPSMYYVINNTVVQKPAQPSSYHTWDSSKRSWSYQKELAWSEVRAMRVDYLQATDWTQLPDVPINTKEQWATYRQALRDITLQSNPLKIVWPIAPAS